MKTFFYVLILAFMIFISLALLPVDTSKSNCIKVSGVIENTSEGGVKDLVFKLKNDSTSYYINRGLENGFTLSQTKKEFISKNATLYYAKNWTPLAPFGTTSKHAVQVTINDTIIYSEWK